MGLNTHRVSNKVSKITSRHLVPLDRAFPAHALVRESKLARTGSNTQVRHRPIANDSGRPSSVIRLSTLHASTDSSSCAARVRPRSRSSQSALMARMGTCMVAGMTAAFACEIGLTLMRHFSERAMTLWD